MGAGAGGAATFVVTKQSDADGACDVADCALREAVLAANASPGADTILLPAGTYQLSIQGSVENNSLTGDLDVRDELEILGDPQAPTTIVGEGTDRVLHILSSSLSISDLTITGGLAGPSGGGVRSSNSDLTVINCTIRGNSTSEDGGGIYHTLGFLAVIDSTITGNAAGEDGLGGGINSVGIGNNPANVSVVNSTISGNSALSGGGIFAFSGNHVILRNSTIANNTASFRGEAFANQFSPAPTFANTLFVGSCAILSNPPVSLGGNVESPGDSCQLPDTDRYGVPDPGIAGLADNGGPTWTHALLPGSLAIDTAVDGECPETDQRGFARPFDGDEDMIATCDVGAYELQGSQSAVDVPALSPMGWTAFVLLLAAAALARLRRRWRAPSGLPSSRNSCWPRSATSETRRAASAPAGRAGQSQGDRVTGRC